VTMRVTESAISSNYLSNVNQAREKIVNLQAQIASGKRVLKPSDDPRATKSILRLKASLQANEQYSKNVEDGNSIAQSTSSALDAVASLFIDLKETVTRASNAAMGGEFPTFAAQVDQVLSEALASANTKFNGKYLFGGTRTTDPPYVLSANRSTVTKNPNGIDGTITYIVGDGLNQQVNIPGEEAFQGTALFDLLIDIRSNLNNGLPPTIAQVDAVNQGFEHILMKASKAGSYARNMDNLTMSLDEQKTRLTQFLSNNEDTDLAESVMQLKQQEAMLDAALNTGGRIIPKTLLDFLL